MNPAQGLAYVVFWFLVVTLGFSLAGLVLAVMGVFTPYLFVAVGAVSAAMLGVVSWSAFLRAIREMLQGGVLPIVVVVLIVVASGLSASLFSAEHVLTNRDPGVYVTTAKWLASEGTLLVDGAVDGFEGIDGITGASLGYYEARTDGLLNPQFMHLLPVWGAVAQWIGGDQALFRVNAVIIAGAIGAFWLFAALLLRPWFAVLASAGLAVNLVTVHFARDVYSEPLMLMLVFASLALFMVAERSKSPGLSIVTGVLIGATAAARLDAWLVVIAFALYLEVRWFVLERRNDRTAIGGFVQPMLLGMTVGGSVSLLDGVLRSAPYLAAHRRQFLAMFGLLILVLLGGLVARLAMSSRGTWHSFERHRRVASRATPIFIVAVATLLLFVRPSLQAVWEINVVAFALRVENLSVDPTRSFVVWPMRWLSWYLGTGGLVVGIVGFALAWRQAILGRKLLLPFLLVASLTTALYVVLPSISADQIWAMRRFLPIAIPMLVVSGVLLAEWAVDRWVGSAQRWLISIAAVMLLVLVPATFAWPLRNATAHRGMYAFTLEVCDALPANSALLVVSEAHARVFQSAVRSFCAVPVAGIYESHTNPAAAIEEARANWAEEGVVLYIGDARGSHAESTVVEAYYQIPEIVLTRRPERLIELEFGIEIVPAVQHQVSFGN